MVQKCFDIQVANPDFHPPKEGVEWANKLEQVYKTYRKKIGFHQIKLICVESTTLKELHVDMDFHAFHELDFENLFEGKIHLHLTYGKAPEKLNRLVDEQYEPLKRLIFRSPKPKHIDFNANNGRCTVVFSVWSDSIDVSHAFPEEQEQ